MMFVELDWQAAVVAVIVLAAAAYFARRALARLRSFGGGAKADVPACGNCEQGEKPSTNAPTAKVLVQIAPSKNATRARGR
ncbi:MAG TPA: hypothetical protein VFX96_18240 [Pyrinomonadaceae bacterium]|nr:hypothetical protein [Pyrinomonadaceae bacterium]